MPFMSPTLLFADSVRISIDRATPEEVSEEQKREQKQPQKRVDQSPPRQALNKQEAARSEEVEALLRGLKPRRYYEIFNRVGPHASCENVDGIGTLCFRDMVELAMLAGLSVKVSESSKSKRITQLCQDPFYQRESNLFIAKLHSSGDYKPSAGLNKLGTLLDRYQAFSNPKHICQNDPEKGDQAKPGAAGSEQKSEAQRLAIVSTLGPIKFTYEIKTRPTYAIYQYLGQILAADATEMMKMTGLEWATQRYPKILSITHDQANCTVDVMVRNRHYCVPDDEIESRNTKLIFNLLTQLIALKK